MYCDLYILLGFQSIENISKMTKYPTIQAIDFVLSIWEYSKLGETFYTSSVSKLVWLINRFLSRNFETEEVIHSHILS